MNVSAIVVSFNGAAHLATAVASVLQQTRPPSEIIVVDDGSTDETARIVQAYGSSIKYVPKRNGGQGSALNLGISIARFPYLAFLDHDDFWATDKLARQSQVMNNNDCDVVVGGVTNVTLHRDNTIEQRYVGPARLFGACLFKARTFDVVGPLREDRHIHEIVEWWGRANGKIAVAEDERTILYRSIHGENQTIKHREASRADLLTRVREVNRQRHL